MCAGEHPSPGPRASPHLHRQGGHPLPPFCSPIRPTSTLPLDFSKTPGTDPRWTRLLRLHGVRKGHRQGMLSAQRHLGHSGFLFPAITKNCTGSKYFLLVQDQKGVQDAGLMTGYIKYIPSSSMEITCIGSFCLNCTALFTSTETMNPWNKVA